ncbi:uncharacterized protein BBA_04605 [Beauveria bassiana ARSEF 2860]|uniref:Uncharacterized protein n=1 Tax=Beauveria bassiana (strain ARSEF 2860) TaxID=655819 RepID=J4W8Y3_BEAB2|nr:uncharacterized protein BBA_04605 [Beauveria bassiana ARSEF 2860]EJP66665.1 hypothetical protein BBA_04605 [Beauveria bassiana ARSEF 2860]
MEPPIQNVVQRWTSLVSKGRATGEWAKGWRGGGVVEEDEGGSTVRDSRAIVCRQLGKDTGSLERRRGNSSRFGRTRWKRGSEAHEKWYKMAWRGGRLDGEDA